jgi:hypothetical protein
VGLRRLATSLVSGAGSAQHVNTEQQVTVHFTSDLSQQTESSFVHPPKLQGGGVGVRGCLVVFLVFLGRAGVVNQS